MSHGAGGVRRSGNDNNLLARLRDPIWWTGDRKILAGILIFELIAAPVLLPGILTSQTSGTAAVPGTGTDRGRLVDDGDVAASGSSDPGEGEPTPPPTGDPPSVEDIPDSPSEDAGTLAAQISTVERLLLDPTTPPNVVERAGEMQQLLIRRIDVDDALADEVIPRIDGDVRESIRKFVEAGKAIEPLVEPQTEYPSAWRIVEPPGPDIIKEHLLAAEAAEGVPWQYLAAIMALESRMGRIKGDSTAGAQGPMQFIPTTWDIYGEGEVHDYRDSVMAAARLLSANGAPGDMANALYRYNPSDSYVKAIERYAQRIFDDERQYYGLFEWQVLYKHVDGITLLPEGWPDVPERIVAPLNY